MCLNETISFFNEYKDWIQISSTMVCLDQCKVHHY